MRPLNYPIGVTAGKDRRPTTLRKRPQTVRSK
nr:MAG TPA: hypothetical protein [Caudoviricetes sp.]DAT52948.1 MAG TPA: hypothetical protein [Caudoviricetes sp.]